jgi:hypothetical protein
MNDRDRECRQPLHVLTLGDVDAWAAVRAPRSWWRSLASRLAWLTCGLVGGWVLVRGILWLSK